MHKDVDTVFCFSVVPVDLKKNCHISPLLFLTGYGGLSLSIEGPSKADIECHDNEDGTCRVTYKPTEPGTYIINIKFADQHVPGKAINHLISALLLPYTIVVNIDNRF